MGTAADQRPHGSHKSSGDAAPAASGAALHAEWLEQGRRVLAGQPFSVLLGARLAAFGPDGAEIVLPVRDELLQQHGFVHGGVVSYLADNALTYAGGAALGHAVVTSEYKINYLRPARGERLVARSTVLHAGRNQAVCRCDVFCVTGDADETLCAVAQGTIARLSSGRSDASPDGSPEGVEATKSRSAR